jgi:hypothetical protein
MAGFAPRFVPSERPLQPVAVAVPRRRAGSLLDRLRRDSTALDSLRALGSPSSLLVFGEHDVLPWVDGAVYLGAHPEAPRLLVPTALAPTVPYALLERALFAHRPGAAEPSALLLDPLRLVDASSPRPFDLASLERWLSVAA